jgi:hypothetical protein
MLLVRLRERLDYVERELALREVAGGENGNGAEHAG